jgi:peptide/nickel transport system substrate-binding protein
MLTTGLVIAFLFGCTDTGPRDDAGGIPEPQRYGGTAVVSSLNEVNSMNHLASVDETSQELQNYVLFTTLIRYDESLSPVPYLAESWDTVAAGDGLALTFHLNDDVNWHDGTPTTANDVKFTFDRIKDEATAYTRSSMLASYDSAIVADAHTITFFLNRHPGFMDPWRAISPMPEHILGDVPAAELRQHSFGAVDPVGNGPFRFVEHQSGDRWVFEANEDFPESLGGRPYLDRLVYRFIPEPTTKFTELLTGALDVYIIVPPAQIAEIEASDNAKIVTHENRGYAFINWNGRRPLFSDPIERRALTLAINRQDIVNVVRGGLGTLATGSIPPFHWAYDAELEPLPYDPAAARLLLDEAGWVDSDGDGVRERHGIRASFELRTNQNPTREDIMTLVQANLADVGIEVTTRVQEDQSMGRDIMGPQRNFDAFVLGLQTEFNIDDRRLFSCATPEGPFHWAGYCNPRVDEILGQVVEMSDRSQSLPLWYEYQEIIQRDQPYTFLYYDVRANGVSTRVHGVEMDIRGELQSVHDWWIAPTDRRLAGS